ncbi:MAG: MBL fold metallo-hydrolase [Planctomycetota bacterium]
MKVCLLPSATTGPSVPHQYLTTFLINDSVAIDAGSLGLASVETQAKVRHVFLTHTHIDHLASLPVFLETVYTADDQCVTVHGSKAVLDCLQGDLFNGRLWPDFVGLSEIHPPFLRLQQLRPRISVEAEGLRLTPVEVDHPAPTQGLLIEDEKSAIIFSADTGPTEELWQRANQCANLKAVFLEVSFPESLTWLAREAKHLTPALFAAEKRKVQLPVRFLAVHIKAFCYSQVVAELKALEDSSIEVCVPGREYEF